MWPLFVLIGLVAVAESTSSGGSSSSSSGDGTIAMTCDQAVAALPPETQAPVAAALSSGTNRAALVALAQHLEDVAAASIDAQLQAALLIAAHCLRARADGLPASQGLQHVQGVTTPTFGAPPTTSTALYDYTLTDADVAMGPLAFALGAGYKAPASCELSSYAPCTAVDAMLADNSHLTKSVAGPLPGHPEVYAVLGKAPGSDIDSVIGYFAISPWVAGTSIRRRGIF